MPVKTKSFRLFLILLSLIILLALLSFIIFIRFGNYAKYTKNYSLNDSSSEPNNIVDTSIISSPIQVVSDDPVSLAELHISEIMPSNKSSLASNDGKFPDWVELYNHSSVTANLTQYKLSCNGSVIDLGDESVPAGEFFVVFCSGKLDPEGGDLILQDAYGNCLDSLTYSFCDHDNSVYWSNGEEIHSSFPTPGYENTDLGYESFQSSRVAQILSINEVSVYNDSFRKDKNFFDWVEVKNISDTTINLSEYFLSDSNSDRKRYQFPDVTLSSNQTYMVFCTDEESVSGPDFASFALNAHYDNLYLSSSDGTLCDYVSLQKIPIGGSIGRINGKNGFFYFVESTPAANNGNIGYREISATPKSLEADGVFNDVSTVTVSLSGPGKIYYSIGGEIPTESSNLYTGPFTIDRTCVVRAVCIESGKLTGTPLSLSYIINEAHSLPVVSLVASPEDWTQVYGSPALEIEKEGSVEFFNGDDSFSINCGFKLHGATSKVAQSKKSLKLCFRSRYDGHLEYNLFDNGVLDFSSVILRSAQEDYYSTYMRDNLMHQLSLDAFPDELVVQDSCYVVLYINGQYWGLYNIREAHSSNHFANHKGIRSDSVKMYRELINGDCPQLNSIYKYMSTHDVSNGDVYKEICNMLDIDSVIAWTIIQAYSGNYDIHPSNVRFYTSGENQIMSYSLADLDLGFFDPWTFQYVLEMNGDYAYKYNNIALWLLNNSTYRLQFVQKLSDVLMDPLSNDNVLLKIDSISEHIKPEIERDRIRWGGSLQKWEGMVQDLRDFVKYGSGRARAVASGLKRYVYLTDYEYNNYFGALR